MLRRTHTPATKLSEDQRALIDHFEADYNTVDHFLRKQLRANKQISFSALVRQYENQNRQWRDAELLQTVAEIRNAIVHGKTEAYGYLAIPGPGIAGALAACRTNLLEPELVMPAFGKDVKTISPADSLAQVLRVIQARDFSQFPVFEQEAFHGLLTENGITRWLARHVSEALSLVELEEIVVADVLKDEEERKTWDFLSRKERMDSAVGSFASNPTLEVVLITENGKPSERLLGIGTRWDILSYV